jgi:diguanylate cyclase (GGDEF)-like protein
VCVEDTAQTHYALNHLAVREGLRFVICVPLKVPGLIVGLLYLNDFTPRQFRREKLKLISVFASFAAMAIYNARLHSRTKLMAITDALTGLHNHRYFQQIFNQELGRGKRYEKPLSIIFMDIDDFKKFNDTYGHANGDLVLALIGKIVTKTLRRIDFAFRYGGEEFAVILPETRLESALQVAERLRERIEKDTVDMQPCVASRGVTVSIGVACFPQDGTTREELFAKVDALLYKAKEGGKNMVHYYKGETVV